MRRNPFAITYRGRNLWGIRTKRSGFSFAQTLQWLLACQWWGLSLKDFQELDGNEQSLMIAAYESSTMMESVIAAEHEKKARNISDVGRRGREQASENS